MTLDPVWAADTQRRGVLLAEAETAGCAGEVRAVLMRTPVAMRERVTADHAAWLAQTAGRLAASRAGLAGGQLRARLLADAAELYPAPA